jgi:RHS repeat-associated protein
MHNDFGERVEKKDSLASGNTRHYYYNDNWQILSEYDSGGTTYKKSYIYGNGIYPPSCRRIDEVLVMDPYGPTFWYYVHDHLYSPVALLALSGTPYERYEYDAYGKCYIMDASYNPRSISSYGNTYYFTGREMDTLDNGSLKIMNYRHRYYDTYTGRFTSHDPLGIIPNPQRPNIFSVLAQYKDGTNLYQYVRSDPMINLDAYGLRCVNKCLPGEKRFDFLTAKLMPTGMSPESRRALDLVDAMSTGIDVILRDPLIALHYVIVRGYIDTILAAYGSSCGWDLYLKIQEQECKKQRCPCSLWLRCRYDWKKKKPYYHQCRIGKGYEPNLYGIGDGVYLTAEYAIGAIDECAEDFEESFDYGVDWEELYESYCEDLCS